MARETDTGSRENDDPADSSNSSSSGRVFDRELLSDLFVNAVPILIVVVFLLVFTLGSPTGGGSAGSSASAGSASAGSASGGDPLLLFHGALIGGVVLVSIVAGWVIRNEDRPLEGTAGRRDDPDGGGDDPNGGGNNSEGRRDGSERRRDDSDGRRDESNGE